MDIYKCHKPLLDGVYYYQMIYLRNVEAIKLYLMNTTCD